MESSSLLCGFIISVLAAVALTTISYFCAIFLISRGLLVAAGQSPDADDFENQRMSFQFLNGEGEGLAGGDGDRECAVCLWEFDDGEAIGLLPECGHSFHVECIDVWLQSHSSCPVCRAKTRTEE